MANLRTANYKGFNYASSSGDGTGSGIFLWSGSMVLNSTDVYSSYSGVGLELIGSSESYIRFASTTSTQPGELDIRAGQFFVGLPESQFISGAEDKIEISSSNFHLKPDGGLIIGGNTTINAALSANEIFVPAGTDATNAKSFINAQGGAGFGGTGNPATYKVKFASGSESNVIGGWLINATNLVDDGNKLKLDPDGDYIISASKFQVSDTGEVTASAGLIAGWKLDEEKIFSDNLKIVSTGVIQTNDFASGVSGWKIDQNGEAEFENATIRGTLSTAVFEKESVNAVGGQLYVANSTVLTGSGKLGGSTATPGTHRNTDTTMSVVNVTGFTGSEIITAKKFSPTGFSTEYMLIESTSRAAPSSETDFSGFLFVERGYGGGLTGDSGSLGDSPNSATDYSGSQVIVSTGRSGSGYIRLNANPTDDRTPYIDIVERTGSGLYDIELKARLGDLSGVANSGPVPANPGFGLYSENVFLSGTITASAGKIGGFAIDGTKLKQGTSFHLDGASDATYFISSSKFNVSPTGQVSGSQVHFNSGQLSRFVFTNDRLIAKDGNTEVLRFDLSSGEIQMDGEDCMGMYLGDASSVSDLATATLPFFAATQTDNSRTIFRVGTSGEFIKFDSSATQKLFISTSNYFLGGASSFISGSNGTLELSSSNFHLKNNGNLTIGGDALLFEPHGQNIISSSQFLVSQSGDVTVRGDLEARVLSSQLITVSASTVTNNPLVLHGTDVVGSASIEWTDIFLNGISGSAAIPGVSQAILVDIDAREGGLTVTPPAQGVGSEHTTAKHTAGGDIVRDMNGVTRKMGPIRRIYVPESFTQNSAGGIKIIIPPARDVSLLSLFIISQDGNDGNMGSFGYNWGVNQAYAQGLDPSITSNIGIAIGGALDAAVATQDPEDGDNVNTFLETLDSNNNYLRRMHKLNPGSAYEFEVLSPDKVNASQFYLLNDASIQDYTNNNYGMLMFKSGPSNPFGSVFGDLSATRKSLSVGTANHHTIECKGDIIAFATSDINLKDNIQQIVDPVDKIMKISGNTFVWNEKAGSKKSGSLDIGVVAQEVDKILPCVTRVVGDVMSVRYEKLIPLLIEGIKEQQKQINELKQLIEGK